MGTEITLYWAIYLAAGYLIAILLIANVAVDLMGRTAQYFADRERRKKERGND